MKTISTQRWIDDLDIITDEFLSLFGDLSRKELNWKPDSDSWSIAQNIDHIIRFNESYYPALDALSSSEYKTPWISRFGFITSLTGSMLLKFSNPDRKRKMSTFKIWEPELAEFGQDILNRFQVHQSELGKRICRSGVLLKNGAVISSPAGRLIVYELGTAFDLILSHEQRHLNQAGEILDLIRGSD